MKQLLSVCLLTTTLAVAAPFESRKPVVCDEYKTVLESLVQKFNERPLWAGRDINNGNTYILTVNEKEGTWTYLETNGTVACVLGVGDKSTLTFGEKI